MMPALHTAQLEKSTLSYRFLLFTTDMQPHGMTDDGQAQNVFKTLEKVPKNCVVSHERISGSVHEHFKFLMCKI